MASIAMLIGGALVIALAFTGSFYMLFRLSKDSIDAKRKKHDLAIASFKGAGRMDKEMIRTKPMEFLNKQLRLERAAETEIIELNDAMLEYHVVFGHELSPLPRELVLSDFHTPQQ